MAHFLYSIDVQIFYFINHTLANPVFDKFFPFITNFNNWIIVYVIFWFFLFIYGGRKGRIAAIGILLLITASDQLSSNLLKNLFERIRPNNVLPDVRLLVGATSSYSFPSSHAVNNFAIATFLAKIYPKYKWMLFTIASLVAFSRPYVGVHYFSDILAGAVIGAFLGYIFALLIIKINNYFDSRKKLNLKTYTRITTKEL